MTVENNSNISAATVMTRGMLALVMALFVSFALPNQGMAQTEEENAAYFKSLIPQKDTIYNALVDSVRRNSVWKRFSLHTNMIDWATLVPNVGVEFDLSAKNRTHYSVMVTGKYNGFPKFGKFAYGVGSVRVEGRKYWRTGKRGAAILNHKYEKLYIRKKNPKYNGDSLRGYGYNLYNKVRRNVFSGRTLDDARYWRAYYLGVWFAYDKFDIAAAGNCKRGNGLAGGLSFGYDIPLLLQRFPKEGSLDLELGFNVGVKAVNCTSYSWVKDETTGDSYYSPTSTTGSYTIVPYPVIQDLHASLVWRLRSINNKVSLSLVDDYQKKIDAFDNRAMALRDSMERRNERIRLNAERTTELQVVTADSTRYANYYNKRRIENAILLNPDTVFTGEDYKQYLLLIKGIDPTPQNLKKLAQQEEAAKKAAEKKAAQEAKQKEADEKKAAAAKQKAVADEAKAKAADEKKAAAAAAAEAKAKAADEKKAAAAAAAEAKAKAKEDAKIAKKTKAETRAENDAVVAKIKEQNKEADLKKAAEKEAAAKAKAEAAAKKAAEKEAAKKAKAAEKEAAQKKAAEKKAAKTEKKGDKK